MARIGRVSEVFRTPAARGPLASPVRERERELGETGPHRPGDLRRHAGPGRDADLLGRFTLWRAHRVQLVACHADDGHRTRHRRCWPRSPWPASAAWCSSPPPRSACSRWPPAGASASPWCPGWRWRSPSPSATARRPLHVRRAKRIIRYARAAAARWPTPDSDRNPNDLGRNAYLQRVGQPPDTPRASHASAGPPRSRLRMDRRGRPLPRATFEVVKRIAVTTARHALRLARNCAPTSPSLAA